MAFDFLDDEDETTSADEVEAMRLGESPLSDVEAALVLTEKVSSLMISVATGWPAPASRSTAGESRWIEVTGE